MSMQPINNSNVNRFEKTENSVSKQFSGSSNPEVLKESTEVLTQALDTASTVAKAVLNIKKENVKMTDTYKEPVVRKIDIDLCREHLEILEELKIMIMPIKVWMILKMRAECLKKERLL